MKSKEQKTGKERGRARKDCSQRFRGLILAGDVGVCWAGGEWGEWRDVFGSRLSQSLCAKNFHFILRLMWDP